ncbi:uncharacterized protein [Paramisgurnus dabryanus]|uniref:uncharacterized protein n=1 Tax=Paramisgurnus dabryanus TaxID=90735 RepID=UPI0031F3FA03
MQPSKLLRHHKSSYGWGRYRNHNLEVDSPPVKQRKAEDWVMAPREMERLQEEPEKRTTEREDERDRPQRERWKETGGPQRGKRSEQVLERERRREQDILQERGGGRKKCLLE